MRERVWMVVWAVSAVLPGPGGLAGETQNLPARYATIPDGPIISEFMACNTAGLRDRDGDTSDWLELFNPGTRVLDLQGWYLTDDMSDLEKWELPEIRLGPGEYRVIFASGKNEREAAGELHTSFSLRAEGESLALVAPDGTTIASAYPDYPPQFADISYGIGSTGMIYLLEPTPGAANPWSPGQLGPAIRTVTENPPPPTPDEDLVIEAEIVPTLAPVRSVTLLCRLNYASGARGLPAGGLAMVDDGTGADAKAGDGVYTAVIPARQYGPGDMVRWAVRAEDTQGRTARNPLFPYPDNSAQYYGTVVRDPGIVSGLPVLFWFTADPGAAASRGGTRASVFFDGEFYDNIFVRRRGGATVGAGSKKFVFNSGRKFRFSQACDRVKEFNFNENGSDPSYLRQPLAFETHRRAGCPSPLSFLMLSVLNGQVERVGVFVEQVDETFLERNGLDPHGALYKFVQRSQITPVFSDLGSGVEKKTRRQEDFSDLRAVVEGLNAPTAEQRAIFVFDHFHLPAMLDYLAARCLLQDTDDIRKNFYFYRDTAGSGEWSIFPWDKDWTFGVVGDGWIYASHPFLGDQAHPKNNGLQWSVYLDVMYNLPQTRQMFLRRTRTVMDELLQAPDTPAERRFFENRVAELLAPAQPHLGDLAGAVNALQAYFPARRGQLYVDHNSRNRTSQPVGGNAGIPEAQPEDATITFGAYEYDPPSGNQDEEYVELVNPNAYAVDLSGWRLAGGIEHTFVPGTVLVAGGRLYVSPKVQAFRSRPTSPKGGEGRLVQGNYRGHLSRWGETVRLLDRRGRVVDTLAYVGEGNPAG
jgi:hypothetical protein